LKLSTSLLAQVRGRATSMATNRQNYDMPPLLKEMEIWLKARTIQGALPKAANAFNAQKLDESVSIMNKMVQDYNDLRFTGDKRLSFYNFGVELQKDKEDTSKALTFGIGALDRILEPNGTAGCLMPGMMTVLLAPTNVGKTSTMVTIAVANIKAGKSVLFVFHGVRNLAKPDVDKPHAFGLRLLFGLDLVARAGRVSHRRACAFCGLR
jgi:flagellar biosynthesis GTPase FlhF